MSDMEDILFHLDQPSIGLYKLLALISIVSIREDYFDPLVEEAIACLVACIVLRDSFPKFNPKNFSSLNLPPLFNELWIIHTSINSHLIPTLLFNSQSPNAISFDSPEDMWISFVKTLSYEGKYNFTKLLEKARPIPLNLSTSLQDLPLPPIKI